MASEEVEEEMRDPGASGSGGADVVIADVDPAPNQAMRDALAAPDPTAGTLTNAELMDPENQGAWPTGLAPGSRIEDMRAWCRAREVPIYGTKGVLWRRIIKAEYDERREKAIQVELHRQQAERAAGGGERAPMAVPTVKEPSKEERALHDLSHFPFQPWCEFCVMGKGTTKHHVQQDILAKDAGAPLIEMDFLHMKSDGSFYAEGDNVLYDDIFLDDTGGIRHGHRLHDGYSCGGEAWASTARVGKRLPGEVDYRVAEAAVPQEDSNEDRRRAVARTHCRQDQGGTC